MKLSPPIAAKLHRFAPVKYLAATGADRIAGPENGPDFKERKDLERCGRSKSGLKWDTKSLTKTCINPLSIFLNLAVDSLIIDE